MKAATNGHAKCLKALLCSGALVNSVGTYNRTALLRATEWGLKMAEFPKLSSNTVVCLSNLLFVCI